MQIAVVEKSCCRNRNILLLSRTAVASKSVVVNSNEDFYTIPLNDLAENFESKDVGSKSGTTDLDVREG